MVKIFKIRFISNQIHQKQYSCKQTDDVAMGSLLFLILINLEQEWLLECWLDLLPKVFKWVADDIFFRFANEYYLKGLVHHLNSKHCGIKFTSEFEESNSFAFLDITITHRKVKKRLKTSGRKTTFSSVFTNIRFFTFSNQVWVAYLTHYSPEQKDI